MDTEETIRAKILLRTTGEGTGFCPQGGWEETQGRAKSRSRIVSASLTSFLGMKNGIKVSYCQVLQLGLQKLVLN